MKKLLAILLFTCSISFAQKINYTYDVTGNRTMRKMFVEPCNTCPQNPQTGRMASQKQDTTQIVAVQHGLNVFPNPTQDKVNLTLSNLKDDETTSVTVSDDAGKILYSANNLQARNEINVSTFNNGTYFVRVMIGKDVVIYKVIKVQ